MKLLSKYIYQASTLDDAQPFDLVHDLAVIHRIVPIHAMCNVAVRSN